MSLLDKVGMEQIHSQNNVLPHTLLERELRYIEQPYSPNIVHNYIMEQCYDSINSTIIDTVYITTYMYHSNALCK